MYIYIISINFILIIYIYTVYSWSLSPSGSRLQLVQAEGERREVHVRRGDLTALRVELKHGPRLSHGARAMVEPRTVPRAGGALVEKPTDNDG